MPKHLAKSIQVDIGNHRVLIDGEEFPYFIAEDGVTVKTVADDIAVVHLEVLAEHVEFVAGTQGTHEVAGGVQG